MPSDIGNEMLDSDILTYLDQRDLMLADIKHLLSHAISENRINHSLQRLRRQGKIVYRGQNIGWRTVKRDIALATSVAPAPKGDGTETEAA